MMYKGYEIEKFNQGEGKWVPNHVIREYYQSEKRSIDRMIKINEQKQTNSDQKSVVDSLEDFFNEYN